MKFALVVLLIVCSNPELSIDSITTGNTSDVWPFSRYVAL